jgi:hypothetical protein|tara:strand:- start:1012 stop:1731 length:720 start_codon:yes stop_codon:yes gene_type:complete
MATFSNFTNRLPDPNWGISEAGDGHATSFTEGPGFASVKFSSQQPVAYSRTNSGRVTTRAIAGQYWSIGITYNPMTRDQFEPIYNFLLEKRGRLKPFFVALPQHVDTRTTTSGTLSVQGTITSGDTNFLIDGMDSITGGLRPGDMFNFVDSGNSNHHKIYKIVRVADSNNKLSSDTALNTSDERRLYVVPPVEKDVTDNSTLDYGSPLFRVVQKSDVQEYSLGTNNLYTFSLNLEEAQA